ncbi:hypothetical protein [Paenibacillus alba]|uniref:Uncharacterized protein n=1 Tax=Paenibacillus alba TaxID=1197127 RepID=A0ABU6GD28_9BACL|nr:hypothetical protein [Paenibacillus alba]MEC0232116.1 hypothetical protein [Paenibacillus alba]
MDLKHYYRQQFLELIEQFEHHWEEDLLYHYGFRWNSYANSTYKEIFQITHFRDESLYMIYTIELPESYKKTNMSDVVKNSSSTYELSMYYLSDKILLSACVSIELLQQTSLGFLNQARGELIDLVFSAIQMHIS